MCPRRSEACTRSMTAQSRWTRARSPASSDPTAQARPRCSTSSPGMSVLTPVTCSWAARRSRTRQRSGHLPWESAGLSSSPGSSPGLPSWKTCSLLPAIETVGTGMLAPGRVIHSPGRAGPPTGGMPWNSLSSPESPGTRPPWPARFPYGQRKLLELSYVLVAEPAIVLLDEPAWRREPLTHQPHLREDPRAEPAGHHFSRCRAQHGVRDGPLPCGHRPRLWNCRRDWAAGSHQE